MTEKGTEQGGAKGGSLWSLTGPIDRRSYTIAGGVVLLVQNVAIRLVAAALYDDLWSVFDHSTSCLRRRTGSFLRALRIRPTHRSAAAASERYAAANSRPVPSSNRLPSGTSPDGWPSKSNVSLTRWRRPHPGER